MVVASAFGLWTRRLFVPLSCRLRQYHNVLFSDRYLLATNIGLSVSLSALGDYAQQQLRLVRGLQSSYDVQRTNKMALAAISFGFICHYWYLWLDRFLGGYTIKTVLKKVVLDQIFLSPFMWIVYFVTIGLIERSGIEKFKQRVWCSGSALYIAEWIVWPPAQIANFYFLQTKHRVLFDNLVSLGFDWYTSYLINDQVEEDEDDL